MEYIATQHRDGLVVDFRIPGRARLVFSALNTLCLGLALLFAYRLAAAASEMDFLLLLFFGAASMVLSLLWLARRLLRVSHQGVVYEWRLGALLVASDCSPLAETSFDVTLRPATSRRPASAVLLQVAGGTTASVVMGGLSESDALRLMSQLNAAVQSGTA